MGDLFFLPQGYMVYHTTLAAVIHRWVRCIDWAHWLGYLHWSVVFCIDGFVVFIGPITLDTFTGLLYFSLIYTLMYNWGLLRRIRHPGLCDLTTQGWTINCVVDLQLSRLNWTDLKWRDSKVRHGMLWLSLSQIFHGQIWWGCTIEWYLSPYRRHSSWK